METSSTPGSVVHKLFFILLLAVAGLPVFATNHIVSVVNFAFNPDTLYAHVGDTVTWQWGSGTHTTTSSTIPATATPWNAAITSSSTTFAYVITMPGAYNYSCTIHGFSGVILSSALTSIERTESPAPVLIYPKPFIGKLTLDLNSNPVFTSNVTVEVFDILGARKYQRRIGDEVNEPLTMDLSDLPQGVYFVALNNGKDKATFKVTKL